MIRLIFQIKFMLFSFEQKTICHEITHVGDSGVA